MKTKTIVITGTSRGIGYEMVNQFADREMRVYALSRKRDSVNSLDLPNVKAISCDLSDQQSIQSATDQIKAEVDQIDVLVHNAGYLVNKPFDELTAEDLDYSYRVNTRSVSLLTQLLLPLLKEGSHVVGVTTMGGVQGSAKFPGLAAYSSSKAAVITLFELLAEEYKERGISFNTLALGAVQTEMLEEAFPGYQANIQPEEMAEYIQEFALNGHRFHNGKCLQVSNSTP